MENTNSIEQEKIMDVDILLQQIYNKIQELESEKQARQEKLPVQHNIENGIRSHKSKSQVIREILWKNEQKSKLAQTIIPKCFSEYC